MNIVIGKMGRSIYFDRKKWKDGAGNNEAPTLFSAVAKLNPDNTYYLIGKSDFSRVTDEIRQEWFPHNNVIDCWKEFKPKEHDPTTWITNVLDGIHIDYGVIHGGMVSLSIPNKIYCLDRKTKKPDYSKLRSPIMSLVNYVSPITYYLNESGIDWMVVTSDGRYTPMQARDLINPEKICLGVRKGTVTFERMKSYNEQEVMVEHKVDARYAFGEFQCLLDTKNNVFRHNEPKTQKVGLFFHQYDNKKRITALKSIIDTFSEDEIVVYGKWNEEGPKFKGSLTYDELQETLPSIKYTFCYPIIEGDISAKWVEAVKNGIIPFFHETYDLNRLLTKKHQVPLWLWVKDAEDMKQKINYLESNFNAYSKLKNMLISRVSAFPKNGATFVNEINRAARDMKNMKK
jgi:hypothetical protein